jgi:catechol 2,3-dioxygenase-like lactoylglutathione lyase family enzyme
MPDVHMRLRLRLFAFLAEALISIVVGACASQGDVAPASTPSLGAVTGMHHLLLTVTDLDRSVHFYRDGLGMRVGYRNTHFVMLQAGDFGVALSTRPWGFEKKGEPKGIGMIPHFTTPNMNEFAERLKNSGIPWLRAPARESFGMEAFIMDPDGYQWAILAPSKPNPSD